eukprot:TRINITY_DN75917_c0_g1_i1.p1 TRINITY_DN75917_c0_g1~~TRINITY_DN75917_c0_g1_i1.p1  ORF type:complete len:413 (-),score=88.94 TRINITY_DN75917_c0_g1_i1:58-1296(-)
MHLMQCPACSAQGSRPARLSQLQEQSGTWRRSWPSQERWRQNVSSRSALAAAALAGGLATSGHRRCPRLHQRHVLQGIEEHQLFESDEGQRYRLLTDQVLGSGAQGTVYRGLNLDTQEKVAIKVIPTWRLILEPGCEDKLASLEQELQTLKELGTHPNIAAMHCHCDITRADAAGKLQPKYKMVVMEAVEGRELAEHVAIGGPMRESVARNIILQVLDGLAHIHKKGIIHRDLKPENVMVTGSEADLESQVKLIDFGVAKSLRNGPLKTVVGTPSIMAPEVAKAKMADGPGAQQMIFAWGSAPGDQGTLVKCDPESPYFCPKIDVWSAGICLYTCLTGKFPFRTELEIIKSDYRRSLLERCSEEAKDLLERMLEKDPERRLSIEECLAHPWVPCSQTDGCTINWDDLIEDAF